MRLSSSKSNPAWPHSDSPCCPSQTTICFPELLGWQHCWAQCWLPCGSCCCPNQWAIFCSAPGTAPSAPWGCPLPLSQLLYELVPSWNWSFSLPPSLHPRQIGNWCECQPWWSLSWLPLFYGTQNIQLLVGYVTHLFQECTGFSYVCLFLLVPVSPRTIPSLVLGVIEMSNEILLLPSSCRCMCLDLNSLLCRP